MCRDFDDAQFPFAWLPSTGVLWWLKYLPRGRVIATPVHRQNVIDQLLFGAPTRGFRRPTPLQPRRSGLPGFEAHAKGRQARRPKF